MGVVAEAVAVAVLEVVAAVEAPAEALHQVVPVHSERPKERERR